MHEKKSKNFYKTWVEVNSRALRHNFSVVRQMVGTDVSILCVVKSNAYGHGLVGVAHIISKTYNLKPKTYDWFGVDSIDEALMLKKSGIKQPILILGYIPKQRLSDAIKNRFRFVLYDINVLKEVVRIARRLKRKAYVHIKIETGTWRQGITRAEVSVFARAFRAHAHEIITEGIYTHFADTENTKSDFYKEQLRAFEEIVKLFRELGISPPHRHMAASAALLLHPETRGTMARLGISLYGLYPSEDVKRRMDTAVRLKPALTWKTRVAQVKEVSPGSSIGYDRSFSVLRQMKIAVLPVGYWDGFDRRLSNKGTVLVGGKRCSIVGRICMNMSMVDVTGVPRIAAGDEAVLLGMQGAAEITAEELAAQSGTINYEVITRINPLIPRVFV